MTLPPDFQGYNSFLRFHPNYLACRVDLGWSGESHLLLRLDVSVESETHFRQFASLCKQ